MDFAFNAIFPPNTLDLCARLSIFFLKSHLAIGSQNFASLSLHFLCHFNPFSRLNTREINVSLLLSFSGMVFFKDFSLDVSITFSFLCLWPGFTDQPEDLRGFPVHTHLVKGSRGFGFNIVGGSRPREFLQVYSVTSSGPTALKTGKNTMNQGWLSHEEAIN